MKFFSNGIAAISALTACAGAAAQTSVSFEACHIKDLEEKARCAAISTPLDWSNPQGAQLDIAVTILPPSGGQPDLPPLYLLAGGPGQAASDGGAFIASALRGARERRETVLVDQRGTGGSAPFECDVENLLPDAGGAELAAACRPPEGAAPRYFTTQSFIRDLDAVREALGHQRIVIWGGSYGTRAGLAYMRAFPERVAGAVLDSVAPPEVPIFSREAETFAAALERTFAACSEDADCRDAFGPMKPAYNALRASLNASPTPIELGPDDATFPLDGEIFVNGLRGALYAPETAAMLPFIVSRAAADDFAPWRALAESGVFDSVNLGLFLSVQCAEERASLDAPPGPEAAFPATVRSVLREACARWDAAEFAAPAAPPSVDAPTLLLSGGLDPITPPENAERALATLTNARHLVAANAGHIVTPVGCGPKIVETFFKTLDPAAPDGDCLAEVSRPPFVVGPAGPKP